jgi:hypothetical protein
MVLKVMLEIRAIGLRVRLLTKTTGRVLFLVKQSAIITQKKDEDTVVVVSAMKKMGHLMGRNEAESGKEEQEDGENQYSYSESTTSQVHGSEIPRNLAEPTAFPSSGRTVLNPKKALPVCLRA